MKPNILLLTVDSLRADRCVGEKKTSKTPNIDSLIKNGVYFTQTIGSSDGTYSALGNIFTALYPFSNNIGWFKNHSKSTKYFDILKNNGYHLYATVPDNQFFRVLTFNFDFKDLTAGRPYLRLSEGAGKLIENRLESKEFKEPWVYYIHIMDLHVIRPVPEEFNYKEYGIDEYDRRISAIDEWIGRILQKINLENTLIIITSDHGEYVHDLHLHAEYVPRIQETFRQLKSHAPKFLEPFGIKLFVFIRNIIKQIKLIKLNQILTLEEKRTLLQRGNDWLYDEVLRIPLIFSGYNISLHKIITQQVRQIDIFPTIAELIGIKDDYPEKEGQSLVPLIQGRQLMELPAYIETVPPLKKLEGAVIGIRTPQYKYYRARNNPKKNVVLFDLQNDPSEKINIAMNRADIVEQMEKVLEQITKDHSKDNSIEINYEEKKKIETELKKLGYI